MMSARHRWLLAIAVGFSYTAMGREVKAGIVYGASATVRLYTSGGPFDGQWTDQGLLTAQEARAASNEYSIGGATTLTLADASAQVDATQVDPVTRHPIIDFAGQAYTSNTGGPLQGEAVADMKFTDVISLRPYTAKSPDPSYAQGVQSRLYFHTVITGSITNQIGPNADSFNAQSSVSLYMNTGQGTSILADTDPSYVQYPNYTRWLTSGNWDSITVDANGNFVGCATLSAPYDSLARGYPYELETKLQTDAYLGASAYIGGLHSAHLVAITYADGSTPESHGYQIVELTGFPSPNLPTAVPEPSSLQLAGFGLTILALISFAHRARLGSHSVGCAASGC
jgi:hypothetical protein